jgi:hypothetical protein
VAEPGELYSASIHHTPPGRGWGSDARNFILLGGAMPAQRSRKDGKRASNAPGDSSPRREPGGSVPDSIRKE